MWKRALLVAGGIFVCASQAAAEENDELTYERAKALCHRLAAMINTGQLEDLTLKPRRPTKADLDAIGALKTELSPARLFSFTDRYGQERRFAEFVGGGSCSTQAIVSLDHAIELGHVKLGYAQPGWEFDDALRWAGWGTSEHLLLVDGEPIVVSANFFQSPTNVALAAWLGDGDRWPLCAFAPDGDVVLDAPAEAPPACRAIAEGKVDPLSWSEKIPWDQARKLKVVGAPWEDYPGGGLDEATLVEADLDGDGTPETIGKFTYSSGAGCGNSWEFLRQVAEPGGPTDPTPVSKALGTGEWGPPHSHDIKSEVGRLALYRIDGQTYILGKHGGNSGVYRVEGERLQQACRMDIRPQVQVEKLYSY